MIHPADVQFFMHVIRRLEDQGHEVLIASRDKDVLFALLECFQFRHEVASKRRTGQVGLFIEMLARDVGIWRMVRRFKPHIMIGFGAIAVSQAGRLTGVPVISFYDNDTAALQNALSHPFASHVFVPEWYKAWLPKGRHSFFPGFKELAYLHPNHFTPDHARAVQAGLDPQCPNYFVRVVAWQATHDWGKQGWSKALLQRVVAMLSARGKVHLSTEVPLEDEALNALVYRGPKEDLHHVMAHSLLLVGDIRPWRQRRLCWAARRFLPHPRRRVLCVNWTSVMG